MFLVFQSRFLAQEFMKMCENASYMFSRLHIALHIKTYLVMFEQDPRYHTQPIFGCLSSSQDAFEHTL